MVGGFKTRRSTCVALSSYLVQLPSNRARPSRQRARRHPPCTRAPLRVCLHQTQQPGPSSEAPGSQTPPRPRAPRQGSLARQLDAHGEQLRAAGARVAKPGGAFSPRAQHLPNQLGLQRDMNVAFDDSSLAGVPRFEIKLAVQETVAQFGSETARRSAGTSTHNDTARGGYLVLFKKRKLHMLVIFKNPRCDKTQAPSGTLVQTSPQTRKLVGLGML